MGPEWPTQNTEAPKPVSVEKTEHIEAGQNIEQELSPEQMELIMAKVQDILKYGTAFSSVERALSDEPYHAERFNCILRYGILGRDNMHDGQGHGYNGHDKNLSENGNWAKRARTAKNAPIFFNIVGRMQDADEYAIKDDDKLKLEHGGPIRMSKYMWNKKGAVAIIFDISNFKEDEPRSRWDLSPVNTHTYAADVGNIDTRPHLIETHRPQWIKEDNLYAKDISENSHSPRAHSEYGFLAHHRIAPRNFRGLILSTGLHEVPLKERMENEKYKSCIKWIIQNQIQTYEEKPAMLLPIYDSTGALVWPKQMSYEEVKKFVEQRDAEKSSKENK